jgi:minimal PKS acyl carrier protein
MPDPNIELQDLRRILQESAGAEQGVDLDGEILDIQFDELGYDSLALMETAARISREYGIRIDDDALSEATTPRRLLGLLNTG